MSVPHYPDQAACCQAIGMYLVAAVHEPWSVIECRAALDEESVELRKHYINANGECRELPFIPMLAESFWQLARLVSTPSKGLFKACHFSVRAGGQYEVSYEY